MLQKLCFRFIVKKGSAYVPALRTGSTQALRLPFYSTSHLFFSTEQKHRVEDIVVEQHSPEQHQQPASKPANLTAVMDDEEDDDGDLYEQVWRAFFLFHVCFGGIMAI